RARGTRRAQRFRPTLLTTAYSLRTVLGRVASATTRAFVLGRVASETRREGSEPSSSEDKQRRRSNATPSSGATEQRSIAKQIGPVPALRARAIHYRNGGMAGEVTREQFLVAGRRPGEDESSAVGRSLGDSFAVTRVNDAIAWARKYSFFSYPFVTDSSG